MKLVLWLTIGFFSFFFGRTFYNAQVTNLEESFRNKSTDFYKVIEKLKDYPFYSEDATKLSLNQIVFEFQSFQNLDSIKLKNLDSLFVNMPQDSFNLSIYLNEQVLFSFYKNHKALQINRVQRIDTELFKEIDQLKEKLKEALIQNPNNQIARHNYLVLAKFYKENNLTFQTAKKLGDLVEKQLHQDLIQDSLSIKNTVSKESIYLNSEKIKRIPTDEDRKKCFSRMKDTLDTYLTEANTKTAKNACLDSLRYHENFDLLFLNELTKGKTSEEIIESFYSEKYGQLYQKSYSGTIKEIEKDTNIQNRLSKILCDFLPEECGKNKENKPNSNEENKENDSQKNPSDKEEKESTEQKNQRPPQKEFEDNKKEMQDAMKNYDENQTKEKENKQAQEQNQKNPDSKPRPNEAQQNATEKEILRKIEHQNEAYQKKNLENMPYNANDDKPSW